MKIFRNQETDEHVEFTGYLMGVDPINQKQLDDPQMWVGVRPLGADHIRVLPKQMFEGTHIEVEPEVAGFKYISEALHERLKIVGLRSEEIILQYDPNQIVITAILSLPEDPNFVVRQEVLDGVSVYISSHPWAKLLAPFSILFSWEDTINIRYNFVKAEPSKDYDYEKTIYIAVPEEKVTGYVVPASEQNKA